VGQRHAAAVVPGSVYNLSAQWPGPGVMVRTTAVSRLGIASYIALVARAG
jgi:hypothetical protein